MYGRDIVIADEAFSVSPSMEITAPPSWLLAEYAPSMEIKMVLKSTGNFLKSLQLAAFKLSKTTYSEV